MICLKKTTVRLHKVYIYLYSSISMLKTLLPLSLSVPLFFEMKTQVAEENFN